MITVLNATKDFGPVRALDNATLKVPQGSVYGLVGPNGAGKSTLIRHIAGIYRPDAGSVLVGEAPSYNNSAVKAKLFCIYDNMYYYLHATTQDLKALCRKLYPSFDEARYEALREAFPEVDDRAALRTLSRGMVKQSAFWLALACRPTVLLLDEPLDGLDPVMRRQVWALLASDVAENATTVLLSSHNLRELEDICDHVGVLNHGRVLLERNLSDLQAGVTKIQILFNEGGDEVRSLPSSLEILHESSVGRMHTYIARGAVDAVKKQFAALGPQYLEALPLTLEEIFIYELEGAGYAVQNVLL